MDDGLKFLKEIWPRISSKQREVVEEALTKAEHEQVRITFVSRVESTSVPVTVRLTPELYRVVIRTNTIKPIELNLGISIINRHIKLLNWILLLDIFRSLYDLMEELNNLFRKEEYVPWVNEIEKLIEYLKHRVVSLIKGGGIDLENTLQQEWIEELLSLTPLEQFYVSDGRTVEMNGDLHSLIEGLKEDVKKGNRANFKGIYELENKFEQLVEQVQADKHEIVHTAVQDMKEQHDKIRNLVLELFDDLDAVYQAVSQLGNKNVTKQVECVLDKALLTLDSYGFEEIKVMGELIDGKTMISLGNVPRNQYAPNLIKNQVYSVHQRGFRDKSTKEVLRKATVITVD